MDRMPTSPKCSTGGLRLIGDRKRGHSKRARRRMRAVLPPNDSDLAIIFQDRCSDLSDIRTTLMAQCLGKFCQSNVLPLHLVCPAAPMSDENLGVPSSSRSASLLELVNTLMP